MIHYQSGSSSGSWILANPDGTITLRTENDG
jgi:hypothetical protein